MGKKLSVNWTELRNLGDRTKDNAEEFEQIRTKMLEIILSIQDCWQGVDSSNFIASAGNYVEKLKTETLSLLEWSEFFYKSAIGYNGAVEDGLNKVRSLREEILLKQNDDSGVM